MKKYMKGMKYQKCFQSGLRLKYARKEEACNINAGTIHHPVYRRSVSKMNRAKNDWQFKKEGLILAAWKVAQFSSQTVE